MSGLDREATRRRLIEAGVPLSRLSEDEAAGFDLSDLDLTGVTFGSLFVGAYLRKANLTNAILIGVDMREADVQGALLCSARLDDADLRSANLDGAYLGYAVLKGALINPAQLLKCTGVYTVYGCPGLFADVAALCRARGNEYRA